MPTEIFNPNPQVFAVKTAGRRADILAQNLWANNSDDSDDDTNEVDLIDQDEIFGIYHFTGPMLSTFNALLRMQISSGQ
jgi:hypothetical protein